MEYLFNWKKGYEELWRAIIRPPRSDYTLEDLGPECFYIGYSRGYRHDIEIKNSRNQILKCSWFKKGKSKDPVPCIIYLHGNSSSRAEALNHVIHVLDQGMSLFSFDFAGCGHSDGEYISLGYYESQDVQTIVKYLRTQEDVSLVGLWGRSMGAVTALMHADRDPGLAAIVLDSPFCSLKELSLELAKKKAKVPNFITNKVLGMLQKTVKEKAEFDIYDLNPLENNVGRSHSPAFFISAEEDELIPPDHAKRLHDAYKGQKRYMLVKGTHNSNREDFVNDAIVIFFYNCFGLDFVNKGKEFKKKEIEEDKVEKTVKNLEFMTEEEQLSYVMELSKKGV